MTSRLERHKKKRKTKKVGILIGALILTISIGSGVKTTFADADVSTMLINWFNNKQSESIQEIDAAITAEKEILLAQLRTELKIEMEAAEQELEEFTENQKATRIASLREHAENLIANLDIDNSEQQAAITSNFNSIIEQAIAEMNGVAIPTPPVKDKPKPEKPDENTKPDSKPEKDPKDNKKPESKPEKEPNENPDKEPIEDSVKDSVQDPIQEQPNVEPTPEPPVEVPSPTSDSTTGPDAVTEPDVETITESVPNNDDAV